jgi:hypothetical protein
MPTKIVAADYFRGISPRVSKVVKQYGLRAKDQAALELAFDFERDLDGKHWADWEAVQDEIEAHRAELLRGRR